MDVFCMFVIKFVSLTIVTLVMFSYVIGVFWFIFNTVIEVVKSISNSANENPDSSNVAHKEG